MKHTHIFIAAIIMLFISFIHQQYKQYSLPQRGITIVTTPSPTKEHQSGIKQVACLPIPPRKYLLASLRTKLVWRKSVRTLKNKKTGYKTHISGKQAVRLKKIVLNPA